MNRDTGYCPHCGNIVDQKDEGEYGIICEVCHNDFWFSECLQDKDNFNEVRAFGNRV